MQILPLSFDGLDRSTYHHPARVWQFCSCHGLKISYPSWSLQVCQPEHQTTPTQPHLLTMVAVQLFRRANENLPPLLQTQNLEEALKPTLHELTDFYRNHVKLFPKESRRLVCDFSSNNFSLQHVEIVARWLQQPTTAVEIYALDLSFNRILCPSWEEFVPLVKQLSLHVQHMDFGGNYLPPLLESDASLRSLQQLPSLVSLSVPYHSQCGNPWVDYWTDRSRQFKELAYGSFETVW